MMYLFLSYCNRLVPEDYCMVHLTHQMGLIKSVFHYGTTWTPRYPALLLMNIFLLMYKSKYLMLVFGIVSLSSFVYTVQYLLKQLFENSLKFKERIAAALLFSMNFYFLCLNVGETWYWLWSSVIYLWSIVFLALGIGVFLFKKKNVVHYLALIVSFFYIGASSEPLALLLITIIAFSLFFQKYRIKQVHVSLYLIVFFTLTAGFCLEYFAPGTAIRNTQLPSPSFLLTVEAIGYSIFLFVKTLFFEKTMYILTFGGLWLYLGVVNKNEKVVFKGKELKVIMVFAALVLIYLTPLVWKVGVIDGNRLSTFLSFLATIFLCMLFYDMGQRLANLRLVNYGLALAATFSITNFSILIVNFTPQIKSHIQYAEAVDARLELIKKHKTSDSVLILDPLPPSGYLYSAELSIEYQHPFNQFFKNGLGLNFDVKRKDEQP